MKKDTHPQYNNQSTATCACGATFTVGSTKDEISTDICSNCHPFYTGKQKLVDTAGRVDRFRAKQAKGDAEKAKNKPEEEENDDFTPEVEEKATTEEEKTPEETKEETPAEETPAEEETKTEEPEVEAEAPTEETPAEEEKAPEETKEETPAEETPAEEEKEETPAEEEEVKEAA